MIGSTRKSKKPAAAATPLVPSYPKLQYLPSHAGSVNSVEVSPCGQFLASGSSDATIRIWPIYDLLLGKINEPIKTVRSQGTESIRHAVFLNGSTQVVSSNEAGLIQLHSIETGSQIATFAEHSHGAVQRLCVNPTHPSLFASAGDDGFVKLWDSRASGSIGSMHYALCVFTVQYSPSNSNQVLVGGSDGLLALLDARMCFTGRNEDTLGAQKRAKIGTTREMIRNVDNAKYIIPPLADVTGVAFNSTGDQFCVQSIGDIPRLFSTESSKPMANLRHPFGHTINAYHAHRPGGTPASISGYYHLLNHKHPAWTLDDQHVVMGSDDFNLYMWLVPSRDRIAASSRAIPIPKAEVVLQGHRSIPTSIAIHPALPGVMFSAGVEHRILVNTATATGGVPVPSDTVVRDDQVGEYREFDPRWKRDLDEVDHENMHAPEIATLRHQDMAIKDSYFHPEDDSDAECDDEEEGEFIDLDALSDEAFMNLKNGPRGRWVMGGGGNKDNDTGWITE
ncbi:WD40-repeat-containing domain protein [Blastocladiella britannica]|nr:WD40-repeat-containing domain protein [Blastocladiella britannica]